MPAPQASYSPHTKPAAPVQQVSIGKRLVHYLVDNTLWIVMSFLIFIVFEMVIEGLITQAENGRLMIYLAVTYVGYYTLFEGLDHGKTPGKRLTRSRVLTKDGDQISLYVALLRSMIRIIPFEAFSFLFNQQQWWHDTWTNTQLTTRI